MKRFLLTLLALVVASSVEAGITWNSAAHGAAQSSGAVTSLTATLNGSTTAGSLTVVFVATTSSAGSTVSVSDDGGSVYTCLLAEAGNCSGNRNVCLNGGLECIGVFATTATGTLSSTSVTVTGTVAAKTTVAAENYLNVTVVCGEGAPPPCSLGAQIGSSANPSTPSIALDDDNDFLVGGFAIGSSTAPTAGPGDFLDSAATFGGKANIALGVCHVTAAVAGTMVSCGVTHKADPWSSVFVELRN